MAAGRQRPSLIVIVGPTASGKTKLAIDIAKLTGGEIVCADSRTVYKDMDIGTAKPSPKERIDVPHWGLDLVKPGDSFSVKDFKNYAEAKITEIKQRGRLPILVGGSGLYINALIYDYSFSAGKTRNPINPRHSTSKGQTDKQIVKGVFMVGLDPGKDILDERIRGRAKQIVGLQLISEVKYLLRQYGDTLEELKAPAYQPFLKYLKKELSLEEATEEFIINDRRLAKKQRTWFRRDKSIVWFEDIEQAKRAIITNLNT